MKLEDLNSGDILLGKRHGSPCTLIIQTENIGHKKRILVIRTKACYFFDSNKESKLEQEYVRSIENGKYKLIGNINSIITKALQNERS